MLLDRLGREGGIFWGRSRCPHCRTVLNWYELIPLASFVFLRGRCRTCTASIARTYPLVEFVTGLLFAALVWSHPLLSWGDGILLAGVAAGLVALLFFDAFFMFLPDVILVFLAGLAVLRAFLTSTLAGGLWTGFSLVFVFGILYVLSRGTWIGFGDVKFVFVLGLLLGYPWGVLAVGGAIWAATVVGLILVAFRRAGFKTALPLGSFLAGSALFIILFQHELTALAHIFP